MLWTPLQCHAIPALLPSARLSSPFHLQRGEMGEFAFQGSCGPCWPTVRPDPCSPMRQLLLPDSLDKGQGGYNGVEASGSCPPAQLCSQFLRKLSLKPATAGGAPPAPLTKCNRSKPKAVHSPSSQHPLCSTIHLDETFDFWSWHLSE